MGWIFSRYAMCFGYYSSGSSFFTCQRGVHTIEKASQQFGVRQFGSYFTLFMVSWNFLSLLPDSNDYGLNQKMLCLHVE
jgi:hypothetical protein